MNKSDSWLNYVSQKLAANGFSPLAPATYQQQGYKYVARRSRFELTKFGMVEAFFTFAEIQDLSPAVTQQFSAASFAFANRNKSISLPNGFFVALFCFAVVITENLHQETADFITNTTPPAHWQPTKCAWHSIWRPAIFFIFKTHRSGARPITAGCAAK